MLPKRMQSADVLRAAAICVMGWPTLHAMNLKLPIIGNWESKSYSFLRLVHGWFHLASNHQTSPVGEERTLKQLLEAVKALAPK